LALAAALFCLSTWRLGGAEPPARGPAPDESRLDVQRSWGPEGGRITSQQDRGDGTKALHGVQVIVGPQNWLLEYAVYNQGNLEERTQFYPSGKTFRYQRREHNGSGYEVVYAPTADQAIDGKAFLQAVLCQGTVKADQRWDGTFLVWEPIPNGYGLRLVLQEFRQGKSIQRAPLPPVKLGLPEETQRHDGWPWDTPDWPLPPRPASP
jgi:hypothetical protein